MVSSVHLSQVLSSGRSRTVSLGEEGAAGLERMEMEEVGAGRYDILVSKRFGIGKKFRCRFHLDFGKDGNGGGGCQKI